MARTAQDRLIQTYIADSPNGLAPVRLIGAVLRFACGPDCPYAHAGIVTGYTITDAHGLVFTLDRTDLHGLPQLAHNWCATLAVPAQNCIFVEEDQ